MSVYFAYLDRYRWQALYSRRRVAAVGRRATIVLVGDQRPRSGARSGIVPRRLMGQ